MVTCGVPSAFSAGRTLVAGLPTQVLPASWQVEQAVAVTSVCTIEGGAVPLALVKLKLVKELLEWQPSQAIEPTGMWFTEEIVTVTLGAVPKSVLPAPWQVLQAVPATAVCTIPGGAVALEFGILKPPGCVKVEGEWQLEQAALPKGTWVAGGCTNAGGAMFAKLSPVAWQVAQALLTSAWPAAAIVYTP